jgi:hypothetical protein
MRSFKHCLSRLSGQKKLPAGVRSFVGQANTVPDVFGGIGGPPSLVIFTDGNQMVLSSDDIVGTLQ